MFVTLWGLSPSPLPRVVCPRSLSLHTDSYCVPSIKCEDCLNQLIVPEGFYAQLQVIINTNFAQLIIHKEIQSPTKRSVSQEQHSNHFATAVIIIIIGFKLELGFPVLKPGSPRPRPGCPTNRIGGRPRRRDTSPRSVLQLIYTSRHNNVTTPVETTSWIGL